MIEISIAVRRLQRWHISPYGRLETHPREDTFRSKYMWASKGTSGARCHGQDIAWSEAMWVSEGSCRRHRRREDAWACEDTSRRQIGRRQASLQRHVSMRRHEKTPVVAKTRGRAKTVPINTSTEDIHDLDEQPSRSA